MTFNLKDLIYSVNGKAIRWNSNSDILAKGVSIDSRIIQKEEVYFAIRGNYYDGHNFIKEAIENGAIAVVCSKDKSKFIKHFINSCIVILVEDTIVALGSFAKAYRIKFKNVKIVGVTGSNGKTTTKEMIISIFNERGESFASKGNFNNRIGLPLSMFGLTSDIKYAVFELGTSLQGEIGILSDILKPDIGIITNIGFSHLRTFVSKKGVFQEKKKLFNNVKNNGFIIINNDDKFLSTIMIKSKNHKIITFALNTIADVYAKNVILNIKKTDFELFYKNSSVKISMHAKGTFNVLNALGAASCAIGFGFSLQEIKNGIENFMLPKMRMETYITKTGIVLINDAYNSNPSSIKESIIMLFQTYIGKKINLVFGDMLELGNKSAYYHSQLGKFLNHKNINFIYLVGKMSFYTKKALCSKNVFYSKSIDIIFKKLGQITVSHNSVFLFKASRAMKLDELFTKFYKILK
ncbi:MAG: UDP-N-acetylmuramoyl-tripeptide--D-alanyl-D-alanine ligase [Endomicrobium sp.]|jgi:UDP-N-acetylmuramoyl-tripeptide--D-alanyl-D-alanine ligase|nr:UDP-N-acetylmuramoyl-tripeptide--D-alanyl-D-alanine ligase [Endomicrobium sp.]